jgi:dipeptidyl aminopeptidase/acylaminoacyl peptidase
MSRSQKNPLLLAILVLGCCILGFAGILGVAPCRFLNPSSPTQTSFDLTLQARLALTRTAAPTARTTASPATADATAPTVLRTATAVPPADEPTGHNVFTCQLYLYQSSEQICIMNADGSGYRRLTTDNGTRHYYPSLSPDGASVVYSQYREDNVYEIYELSIADGATKRLTNRLGVLTGPEISPDGKSIVFVRWTPASDQYEVWLMKRDGADRRRLLDGAG